VVWAWAAMDKIGWDCLETEWCRGETEYPGPSSSSDPVHKNKVGDRVHPTVNCFVKLFL